MSATSFADEVRWLVEHPEFNERPATLEEFLGENYLNIKGRVRKRILTELKAIMGDSVSAERPTLYQWALITGGIGIGKELRYDEPVLTPKGWRDIGTLSPGDKVIGRNGQATTVTAVFPQGRKPLYRVRFIDGGSVLAGLDHQWSVKHFKRDGWTTMTTRELLDRGLQTSQGQRIWSVPLVSPVKYEGSDRLPISPYTYGALLGDGGLTSGVKFSTQDDAILDRLRSENPDITFKQINKYDWRLVTERGRPNPLLDAARSLGMNVRSEHKSIHETYLRAEPAARLEVLRGLMDTDGWHIEKFNTSQFSSSSRQLVDGVVELVRSLGGLCSEPSFKSNDGLGSWQVTVKLKVCPFWVERKSSTWSRRTSNPIVRTIDSIEYECDDEAVCISVAAPDQLYVTRDFIVTHNTTIASIVLPYLAHWLLCLKDPQEFFNLLPGSRIALMMMSTSESQAREVLFGDVKARIAHSPWFKKFPYDPAFKNQIRFEQKEIWIVPGDSAETTFEGYNILGGILDEADSHKVTDTKDYADVGYDAINSRIASRFQDRGFLLIIGQKKKAVGFVARKMDEFRHKKGAYVCALTIWDSMGDEFYADPNTGEVQKFAYDIKRKNIVPSGAATLLGESPNIIWVPDLYRDQFGTNPEKALRDLAGIPPAVGDPFISLTYKIDEARDRWVEHHPACEPPVDPDGRFWPGFVADNTLKRVAHIDIAYSANGDALGFAMGHVPSMVEVEGEIKPYIVIDLLVRMKAPAGGEIFLSDVRRMIYMLRDQLHFKIDLVTMDGFESTDTNQQLRKKRFRTDYVSVDKQVLPYHDLREALYEDRIEFPPFLVNIRRDVGTEQVEILHKELMELVDNGRKIDHPVGGSKDVADAVAGVTFSLMGDRRFRRRTLDMEQQKTREEAMARRSSFAHPAVLGDSRYTAPLPPAFRR